MLVLSRRPEERISFPTLGISVRILRVTGQTVRVGVDAPKDIPILRDELEKLPKSSPAKKAKTNKGSSDRKTEEIHRLRNRLNAATMALYVAQKQLQAGLEAGVEDLLEEALVELDRLEREMTPDRAESDNPRSTHAKITALLVEDNLFESSLLESYLRLRGIEVIKAPDGFAALEILEKSPQLPDAVLLDMQMPRCDGPTTISEIRQNPAYRRLKVFAVSGSSASEYALPEGDDGVNGWFQKPLDPSSIVRTLSGGSEN